MAPVDFLWKLRSLYSGFQDKHEPVLSGRSAALLSAAFTLLYVLPFYLSPRTRPSPTLNRDAPSVIQARIRFVTITVTISTLTTLYILHYVAKLDIATSLHHLGFYPISPLGIVKPIILTAILYTGPLYEQFYLEHVLSPISTVPRRVYAHLLSSQGYRNFIAGPLTEELLFRSTFIPIHLLSEPSPVRITFLTPLYFGIAHCHHFYEFTLSHPDTPLLPALLRTVFQFIYTTLFGWFASFIYLRTGSLYAVFAIHAFANFMGLPRFWGRVYISTRYDDMSHPYDPSLGPVIRGKDDAEVEPLGAVAGTHGKRHGRTNTSRRSETVHTVIYYILLVLGAWGFKTLLFPLTEMGKGVALVKF